MSSTLKPTGQNFSSLDKSGFKDALRTHFELGRVSNLPTVWSNVFCGVVIAVALIESSEELTSLSTKSSVLLLCLLFAMSAFYIAGMYLNDACDAAIDSIERTTRPIPSGRISRKQVFLFAGVWFFIGWACLITMLVVSSVAQNTFSIYALSSAAALTACIILYDMYHKNNPASPVVMGMCRVFLVCTCYLGIIAVLGNNVSSITSFSDHRGLWLVCALILCYLCGLTFIAKFENSKTMFTAWPVLVLLTPVVYGVYGSTNTVITLIPTVLLLLSVLCAVGYVRGYIKGGIPKAIGILIAGISLIDAIIMSAFGSFTGMCFGIAAFFLTLLLQRKIAGT